MYDLVISKDGEGQHVLMEIYAKLLQWLENYIQNLNCPNILCQNQFDFKYKHTLRVVDEITSISITLGLTAREILLAKTIALLHDVGRFEQYKTYGTYNDRISIDHGALGVDIIKKNDILNDFKKSEQAIICHAVLWHNQAALTDERKGAVLFFSKLIRDADKLDILQINMEEKSRINIREKGGAERLSEDVSDHIYKGLMQGKTIHYGELGNKTDLVLSRIGWIFDLNFTPTFCEYAGRCYFETFSSVLPATPKIRQVLTKTRAYLDQRCTSFN